MTGGEAVVGSLEAHNVRTVFGIPGSHNLSIYDALAKSDLIRHIVARHEQGAGFMADGYARACGEPGVCITTTGPAALNTLAALGTAFNDSSPVLLVTSQNPTANLGANKGLIHEISDQLDCFRPVTRLVGRADTITSIPGTVNDTFKGMLEGRHRPAVIEVPSDLLDGQDAVSIPGPIIPQRLKPRYEHVELAAKLLASARRPAIWAGGGVISSDASNELVQLAEAIQAPVFTTVLGKGAIPGDHPLSAGSAILHPLGREFLAGSKVIHPRVRPNSTTDFQGCDLLLAVGTRFTDEETDSWTLRLPESLIQVDIDTEEISRNYTPTAAVVGDAREVIRALISRLAHAESGSYTDRTAEISQLRKDIRHDCIDRAPEGVGLVETLRSALPRDTILVSDLTIAAYWCRRLLDVYQPRTSIYPWGFGTLGYAVPAAIGAKLARPDRPVVALVGDGGFLFNCQELATAIQHDVPVVILVFNDNAYGVLKSQQEVLHGRTMAVDLVNPDFLKLAEAFGVDAQCAETFEQLYSAVTTAINSSRASLIEVTIPVPWPAMEPSAALFNQAGKD